MSAINGSFYYFGVGDAEIEVGFEEAALDEFWGRSVVDEAPAFELGTDDVFGHAVGDGFGEARMFEGGGATVVGETDEGIELVLAVDELLVYVDVGALSEEVEDSGLYGFEVLEEEVVGFLAGQGGEFFEVIFVALSEALGVTVAYGGVVGYVEVEGWMETLEVFD